MSSDLESEGEDSLNISINAVRRTLSSASNTVNSSSDESMNIYLNDESIDNDPAYYSPVRNYGYGNTVSFSYPKLKSFDGDKEGEIDFEDGSARKERIVYPKLEGILGRRRQDDTEEEMPLVRGRNYFGDIEGEDLLKDTCNEVPYYGNSRMFQSRSSSGFSFHNDRRHFSESSLSSPSTPEPISGKLSREEGGRVGLRNLGNTCYLNSTLQCLTATEELSYWLAEEFENGNLLKAGKNERRKMFLGSIGRLFHEMWQSEGKSTSLSRLVEPRQFKSVLGMIDSRFSGYRQEDSQEALAIILDRLHEDLKSEYSGESEIDCADGDGWEKYCRKENSLVRKLMHGQLKSTVKCSCCSFESETFDPFCFLNLPIPLEPEETATADIVNNSRANYVDAAPVAGSEVDILCYNDKIFNADSAYLIRRRHFRSLNDFRSFFRGSAFWVIEFEPAALPISIHTKLLETKSKKSTLIAYRADLLEQNYLISFVAGKAGDIVGFPVMVKLGRNETALDAALFIKTFLNGSIRPILRHRFPERLAQFDCVVSLMLASPNEYFKIELIGSEFDLIKAKVIILNDKSDFNEMIFFEEVDDPNDLFEELVWESEGSGDEAGTLTVNDRDSREYTDSTGENASGSSADNYSLYPEIKAAVTGSNYSAASSSTRQFIPTLKDCFNRLCSVETLDWKCEKCLNRVQAEKRMQLWRLPDILILHLKRFSYGMGVSSGYGYAGSYFASGIGGGGAKIGRAVDFALEIDLKDVLAPSSPAQSTKYELYAISQHFGSLHFGHYTAILKHQKTAKWFLADDSSIKVFTDDHGRDSWFKESVREAAYVLFYRRIK